MRRTTAILATVALSACGPRAPDPRGVDHDETLLSVSATGEAETVPDEAYVEVGVNSFAASAQAASEANNRKIDQVLAALAKLGVPAKDTQTRNLSIQKIDYGPNRGQYQASNVLQLRVREVGKAGAAVAAATAAGANILSGPQLRISDPEAANRGAYAAAYKAARSRAEAYAGAAGLEIARVLAIRDGGRSARPPVYGAEAMAQSVAPPPVAMPPPPEEARILAGTTLSQVAVQVDFALRRK